jgi:ubiquinone/menaquinone biosynthesis C-methylase UbiE
MKLASDSSYFLQLQTQTGWGRMLNRFAEWCRPQKGWLALDVGCGPGLLPALLTQRGCRALGVDLDPGMFTSPLHPALTLADALHLPFPAHTFHLVTASNLLFLLPDPLAALREMVRVLHPNGQLTVLNPSEQMNVAAATALADQHNLQGLARQTLINLGRRAEKYHHWCEADLREMFATVGLYLTETTTKMGPGLIRFARAKMRL